MGAVRLGKIHLHWCNSCNLPIVEKENCSICSSTPVPVEITPPGDPRPAFKRDRVLLRTIIDRQFGEGCADILAPNDKVILLNRAPAVDRMDEVIVDGLVLGALVYLPGRGHHFIPRLEGAKAIEKISQKGRIFMDGGAEAPMMKGASALAVGIMGADPGIEVGDDVLIYCNDRIIATGMARMSSENMLEKTRDSGAKTRWYGASDYTPKKGGQTLDDFVKANEKAMRKRVKRATSWIKEVIAREGKPVAVSFSGGKDSLATLLLVVETGERPTIMFSDTGIEFQETLDNIAGTAERLGLPLVTYDAGDAFWRGLEHFGPPGKDFRWCCKGCKLGPTSLMIKEHFPDGVLSFIGQRQYESEMRYSKDDVWKNPWVPGQIGASPIQKWTALHVWAYLLSKDIPVNPLYYEGFERIGCWLCPSGDMAEQELAMELAPDGERFREYLEHYRQEKGLPEEWLDMGMWRWVMPSKGMIGYLKDRGYDAGAMVAPSPESPRLYENTSEGRYRYLGKEIELMKALVQCSKDIELQGEEMVVLEKKGRGDLGKLARKAEFCVGCGICVSACPTGALALENNKIILNAEKCTSCGLCIDTPCPVVIFNPR